MRLLNLKPFKLEPCGQLFDRRTQLVGNYGQGSFNFVHICTADSPGGQQVVSLYDCLVYQLLHKNIVKDATVILHVYMYLTHYHTIPHF